MGSSVSLKVEKAISSGPVVIFSKTNCPFCIKVKEVFKRKEQKYVAVEIDKMSDGSQIQDYLKSLTGARTVPRIFIKGKCYGGCDDLMKLDANGELDKILGPS